jgi:hypothetical protein
MTPTLKTQATSATTPWKLTAIVRKGSDEPELGREPVTEADLLDITSEAWLEGVLRRGKPDAPFESGMFELVPIFKKSAGGRIAGVAIYASSPDQGEPHRSEFTLSALGQAAERAAERLQRQGVLKLGDTYTYEITASRKPAAVAPASEAAQEFTITAKHPLLHHVTVPLAPLLAQARTVGSVDDRMCHVFFTVDALERTEKFARRGADQNPPVETGAILIGNLCSCPETGEFFVVVVDALEVQDAEQTKFTLSYSGKSWSRIQAVLKARQAQPATRAQRMVGQAHGHNFLPADGAPPCEVCSKVSVCTRTSVFVSSDDRDWSRAVFARQPWQLCHIFGLNARRENVQALYGLRDGRLQERGYHVIPAFQG